MVDKIRVLHVIGGLGRGGIETLMMNIFREFDRGRFQFDFLVQEMERSAYDDEVEALGGKIHRLPGYRNLITYGNAVTRIIRGYDIVHSHVYAYSGFHMLWAKRAGVKQRIAHAHTVRRADDNPSALRGLYLKLMRTLIQHFATDGYGCTAEAGRSLFGGRWDQDLRCRLFYNAIDLDRFEPGSGGVDYRDQLGIPTDATVLGHVGRFVPEKNHAFLIELMDAFRVNHPEAHLVLVGDGPGRAAAEQQVALVGMGDMIHFLGLRDDVPELMTGLFDVLLLPSLWEGVPLTVIEAQAAGLKCLASTAIPAEAVLVPELVKRLNLQSGVKHWVKTLKSLIAAPVIERQEAFERIKSSGYNARVMAEKLAAVYAGDEGRDNG